MPPDSVPPAAAPHPAFALAPETAPRLVNGRVKYPELLSVYAALYDCAERSVKRMIEEGRYADPEAKVEREPLDLPPLHQPAEMPAWWQRRHKNRRVPLGILKAAARKGHADPATPPSTMPAAPPTVATADPSEPARPAAPDAARGSAKPPDYSAIVTSDFPAQVESMRREDAIIRQSLELARQGTEVEGHRVVDQGAVESLVRQRVASSQELRKAENDLLAWLKERELLVSRVEVRSENTRIAGAIFAAVRRLVRNVRPQLAGKSAAEQDRLWDEQTRLCFAAAREAKYTDHDAALATG